MRKVIEGEIKGPKVRQFSGELGFELIILMIMQTLPGKTAQNYSPCKFEANTLMKLKCGSSSKNGFVKKNIYKVVYMAGREAFLQASLLLEQCVLAGEGTMKLRA